MASDSAGQISLDLVVNQKQFNKQMAGITGLAKKAGTVLAAAFSVKKLVDFGAACVELGSDLQEVQNVVDVAFPSMSKRLNAFASDAAESFGLSETMAKRFAGTFGTMAKSFGFSEKAAYDMSTTLTGLAGDVASFYNISQDEAYTKLKSVFTGETESLKELGVVMTQTALDSYALANGIGKTTANMSEAEKVALRYQFVQEQLSGAAGDFIRTSDSWANQVRVLKLQFDSLKATIGQGLINVLTPVIKVINSLLAKLMTLANAFRSFTEMITGKKGTGAAAGEMEKVSAGADAAAASTEGIGKAAASSAKKMKGLFAFDEMNVAESKDAGGGASAGMAGAAVDFGSQGMEAIAEADAKISGLQKKVQELFELFRQGFQLGIGDADVFGSISESVESLKNSFVEIFTAPELTEAAEGFIDSLTKNLGIKAGALISVGASIADNLTAGIAGYFSENKERVTGFLADMFDLGSRLADISGSVSAAVAEIAEALRSEGAKRITEALTGTFMEAGMGIAEFVGNLGTDLAEMFAVPFIENSEKLKGTLEGTLTAIAPVFEEIQQWVTEAGETFRAAYDGHIKPMLTAFQEGFTQLWAKGLEAYNTHFLPVIEGLSEKFSAFRKSCLTPLVDKFSEFAGKTADAVSALWTNILQPFAAWFIENIYPVLSNILSVLMDVIFKLGEGIGNTIGGIITALSGIMDFLVGVFTGDWETAWNGIKEFFSGVWDFMYSLIDSILQAIYSVIADIMTKVKDFFTAKWTEMKQTVTILLAAIKTYITDKFTAIYTGLSAILTKLKSFWGNIWTGMKNTVVNIFNGIWSAIKKVINSILGGVESMANGIVRGLNRAIEALNRISFTIPEWVPELGGMSFGFSVPQIPELNLPRLAQGGYVKPNTPQLAMIGDNRHQGEIVAPEDKIYNISAQAMQDVMKQFIAMMQGIIGTSQRNITVVLKVTGEMAPFVRLLKAELDKENARTGINLEVVYE